MKQIEDAWDKLVISVFKGSNSAFYGSLLCSMDIDWTEDIPTIAMVNPDLGMKIKPSTFLALPEDSRNFLILHEIEHIARLHHIREEHRDHALWNEACDHEINLAQIADGLTHVGLQPLADSRFAGLSAEEIYKHLEEESEKQGETPQPDPKGSWGDGNPDMEKGSNGDGENNPEQQNQLTQEQINKLVNTVVKASQTAKLAGSPMASVDSILDKFLKPSVDWNKQLRRFLIEKLEKRIDWSRPKRRYEDIYLPRRVRKDSGLTKIHWYLDTSGSISDEMVQIFNSEVKYVHEHFNPKTTTLVQFDTDIRHEVTFTRNQKIKSMQVSGRGGTCLECVHNHILDTKPDVVVVLSDLYCYPMERINGVEILWVVFDNEFAEVQQGKLCHVSTK